MLIGTDRSLHGVGAGIAMTAIVADQPRLSTGDWHAALHPHPWLTGGALILAAVYALVAEGAPTTASRTAFPATERAQLALLIAPVGGICAIAVAATYRGEKAVVAAAIAAAVALLGITAVTARAGTAARFAALYLAGPGTPLRRSAALRGTRGAASGTAGAMAGAVLLRTGLVAGFLAAAAMQVRALTGVRSAPGVQ